MHWAFEEDRVWHYDAYLGRHDGKLLPLAVSIRFPYTDLPEVVRRLKEARPAISQDEQRPADEVGEGEICAVCSGCGRVARDDWYVSVLPDGSTAYWSSQCTHDYEPGDVIDCRCGMLCPYCQSPEELAHTRGSG